MTSLYIIIQKYSEETEAHEDVNTKPSARIDSRRIILQNKVIHGPWP